MDTGYPGSLHTIEIGGGEVSAAAGPVTRMTIPLRSQGYADAQLDDYRDKLRRRFPWSPPVRLKLRARASESNPAGTLGFGFWNDPFTLSIGQGGAARRLPSAPQAVWFFYGSAHNQFTFSQDSKGHGFKAMAIRSPSIPPLLLAPMAATGILMAQIPGLRRPVIQTALRAVKSAEVEIVEALDEWHEYVLDWDIDRVRFEIDGRLVLLDRIRVPGPLGFVTWIDNQYAVASPEKGFRFGVIPTDHPQWLEISGLEITGTTN